jgi:hypothetical protein
MKMKFLLILVFCSCAKNMLITNHEIEGFKLGEVISNDFEFDKNELDITTDEAQKIITIIISSESIKQEMVLELDQIFMRI